MNNRPRHVVALLFLATLTSSVLAADTQIQNDTLIATLANDGTFSLATRPDPAHPFIQSAHLTAATGSVQTSPINDPHFGQGQQLTLTNPTGTGGTIRLFPKLPFALLNLTLTNSQSNDQNLNQVPLASLPLSLNIPVDHLSSIGTGGLSPIADNPGSYVWVAIADPQSRKGVVAGFLTNDLASGVLFPKLESNQVRIDAREDFGHLRIASGKSADTDTLAIGLFDDTRIGLEQWASAVAQHYDIHLPAQPVGYCTWYAEKHGAASDAQSLAELTDFAAKNLAPFGFNFIQINDHWQMGPTKKGTPRKNFSAADPAGPYPAGMKPTADNIKAHHLTPGIWFMPFAATADDPWFADKQDLLVHDTDGKIYDARWGGNPLDMTNPKAQAYLRSIVQRIAHDWGFTYFKLDGLWTGLPARQNYVNAAYKDDHFGDAILSNPDMTNVEAYRTGMKILRETAGPNVFILGCNMAQKMRMFGASFGLFDAMRVGPDNSGNYARWARSSPLAGSREYFLNGRIWFNDADPQYVRESIPLEEARTIASWTTITGALNTDSDWLPDLPPDRLDILRRTMPSHGKTARPVDYLENDPPRIWIVTDETSTPRRDVVGVFNWSDKETTITEPVARLGLPELGSASAYVAFDFWANRFLPPLRSNLSVTLPPHGCAVLAIRPMLDRPFLLSTSRHITQGMVDLTNERWDAATATLSGTSQIVGNDPYELRVVIPHGEWSTATATTDGQATIKLSQFAPAATQLRATITSDQNATANWKITFAK